jgi:alkylhydroperoxidase/carboxymuconolactone decarboxylase family protein YurZ
MKESPPQKAYRELTRAHPEFMAALEAMGEAARSAGPLDARTVALVKLAYGIGAGLEGATHSQVGRALEAGCSKEELLQVALLATPTIGFPTMVRGRCWVLEAAARRRRPTKGSRRPLNP